MRSVPLMGVSCRSVSGHLGVPRLPATGSGRGMAVKAAFGDRVDVDALGVADGFGLEDGDDLVGVDQYNSTLAHPLSGGQ